VPFLRPGTDIRLRAGCFGSLFACTFLIDLPPPLPANERIRTVCETQPSPKNTRGLGLSDSLLNLSSLFPIPSHIGMRVIRCVSSLPTWSPLLFTPGPFSYQALFFPRNSFSYFLQYKTAHLHKPLSVSLPRTQLPSTPFPSVTLSRLAFL